MLSVCQGYNFYFFIKEKKIILNYLKLQIFFKALIIVLLHLQKIMFMNKINLNIDLEYIYIF